MSNMTSVRLHLRELSLQFELLDSVFFQTGKIERLPGNSHGDTVGADMVKNEIDKANSSSTFRRQDAERPDEGVIKLQLSMGCATLGGMH